MSIMFWKTHLCRVSNKQQGNVCVLDKQGGEQCAHLLHESFEGGQGGALHLDGLLLQAAAGVGQGRLQRPQLKGQGPVHGAAQHTHTQPVTDFWPHSVSVLYWQRGLYSQGHAHRAMITGLSSQGNTTHVLR